MEKLRELHSIHVQPGTPALSESKIDALKPEVPPWMIVEAGSQKRLECVIK
ncbi:MAG TPA: hypothetical protein VMS73_08515 [Anaerolineaceae bacterium]|nr:hypothetical protein [Anaerolineaceae bacterium]